MSPQVSASGQAAKYRLVMGADKDRSGTSAGTVLDYDCKVSKALPNSEQDTKTL